MSRASLVAVLLATAFVRPHDVAGQDAAAAGEIFRFVDGFSSTQGAGGWHYKEFDGARYADMRWDAAAMRWQGRGRLCQVWQGAAHPDATEAVIAWRAPRDGDVTVDGVVERLKKQGDGTRVKILKNKTRVWPSGAWQEVYPSFMARHCLVTSVKTGDWLYFHVNRGKDAGYDDTFWEPTVAYDSPPKFTLDGAEVVAAEADLKRVGIHTMDASLSVLPPERGTRLTFLHSEEHGERHQKFTGTLDAPARRPAFEKTAAQFFTANPSGADGRWWLNNVHRDAGGGLLGFMHVEGSGDGKKYRVGLAYSTDDGDSWVYLGHIIRQHGDPDGPNITGVPYVVRDGHFYIYYADAAGPCVARAPVEEVLAAAKAGKVSPWHKLFEGDFTEPGWGGRCTPIDVENALLHGDAAWCATKRKFLLTGYNHGEGRGVWIAFSDDAVRWTKGGWLQHGRPGNTTLSPYVTIVDEDGSDNAEVGDGFYAYWGFTPDWEGKGNLGLRYVVRQKVTLVAP